MRKRSSMDRSMPLMRECMISSLLAIERDVSKWAQYCKRPSDFIQSPDSPYYAANEEIMNAELDYLIETRPDDGVWGIMWSYFDAYPKEYSLAENWWKADRAVSTIRLLKNFGRLEQD